MEQQVGRLDKDNQAVRKNMKLLLTKEGAGGKNGHYE